MDQKWLVEESALRQDIENQKLYLGEVAKKERQQLRLTRGDLRGHLEEYHRLEEVDLRKRQEVERVSLKFLFKKILKVLEYQFSKEVEGPLEEILEREGREIAKVGLGVERGQGGEYPNTEKCKAFICAFELIYKNY